jgi:hypothetical protein
MHVGPKIIDMIEKYINESEQKIAVLEQELNSLRKPALTVTEGTDDNNISYEN